MVIWRQTYGNGRNKTFYLTMHSTHFIYGYIEGRKEENVLFNDTLNTFYLRLYGVRHMVKDHSDSEGGRKETFYLTTHSTHFIYGYMASNMVKDHSDSEKGNPLPPHRLLFTINSKGSLYAPSHRQDITYHSLCYTSRGALAGTRNSSMGHHEGSIRRPIAPRRYNSLTRR